MSKGNVFFRENAVEYYTPKYIVDMFGPFDYDPATTKEQAEYHCIKNYDTKETDGLISDWTPYKRIWINPPFSIKKLFFEKAVMTYLKTKADIYFLCPIEFLTTNGFQSLLGNNVGVKVFLPNGRIRFSSGVGLNERSPAFGSVIVRIQDKNELELLNIKGIK